MAQVCMGHTSFLHSTGENSVMSPHLIAKEAGMGRLVKKMIGFGEQLA